MNLQGIPGRIRNGIPEQKIPGEIPEEIPRIIPKGNPVRTNGVILERIPKGILSDIMEGNTKHQNSLKEFREKTVKNPEKSPEGKCKQILTEDPKGIPWQLKESVIKNQEGFRNNNKVVSGGTTESVGEILEGYIKGFHEES